MWMQETYTISPSARTHTELFLALGLVVRASEQNKEIKNGEQSKIPVEK